MKLSFCLLFIFILVVRPLLFVRKDSLAVKSNTSVNWRVIGRDNVLLGKHVQIFVCVVVDKMVIIRPNKFSFTSTNWLLLNGLHSIHVITFIIHAWNCVLKWKILLMKGMCMLLLSLYILKLILATSFNQSLLTLII